MPGGFAHSVISTADKRRRSGESGWQNEKDKKEGQRKVEEKKTFVWGIKTRQMTEHVGKRMHGIVEGCNRVRQ